MQNQDGGQDLKGDFGLNFRLGLWSVCQLIKTEKQPVGYGLTKSETESSAEFSFCSGFLCR